MVAPMVAPIDRDGSADQRAEQEAAGDRQDSAPGSDSATTTM